GFVPPQRDHGAVFIGVRGHDQRHDASQEVVAPYVKSQDTGSRLWLSSLAHQLEWSAYDQCRANAVSHLAVQDLAAFGHGPRNRGAPLPVLWNFAQDLLQVETALRRTP